jgi:MFS superfamily sulfate permease-like transporter
VDFNAKPPRAQMAESNGQAQVEQLQQLREQVFYLQEQNLRLEEGVKVELAAQIRRQLGENDRLAEKNRHLIEDVKRLEEQLARMLNANASGGLDALDRREEGELWRERRILDLEKELAAREAREAEQSEQLYKADEKVLDLRFQKETFDLKYARLQKRITDLEQYKLASAQYSSILLKAEDKEKAEVAASSGLAAATLLGVGAATKRDDVENKLRSKSTKSTQELELLVESLKRVIEKQRVEADTLKARLAQLEER